jgi:hypothetical protein
MKKQENSENKRHVEVIFVMPLGVDESLFIWGIHFIKDYLRNTCDSIDAKVWDFRFDTYFRDLNKRYSNTLGKLFLSLKPDQVNTFYRVTNNPDVFLNVAALPGDDFFRITGLKKWFRHSCARDLRALQKEVNDHIAEKIEEYKKENPDAIRIWAFSVFDNSLFSALHIARLVKEKDPTSSVILGNDAFTFQAAEKIMKSISFVDGITFGYGEEIMRTIVSNLQEEIPVQKLRIKGLVNDFYIRNPEESQSLRGLNIPSFYREFSSRPLISCIKQPKAGEIRICSQRGCKWGKCVFCTQYDRGELFPMSGENLYQRLKTELDKASSTSKDSPIFIVFDSYENEPDIVTGFLSYLDSIADYGVPIDVMLFLQIKSFRKEFFDVLANIDKKKIRILFRIYIESLNVDTLRNMRKGNSPLQAIEAVKAVQDCGHFVGTNCFSHFPLETRHNVARETELLKRIIHLLMPPKGVASTFPYLANDRDAISQNQEKYKIKVKRLKKDTWLKDVFGIDLPFSHWAFYYNENLAFSLDRLLVWSYYNTIKANVAEHRPRWIAETNWGDVKIPIQARIAFCYRWLKLVAWKCLHYSLTLIGKGNVFRKRSQVFQYLARAANAQTSTRDDEGSVQGRHSIRARMLDVKKNIRQSHFYLEGNCLKKEYNGPGKKENWSREINGNELKVLRYLYWSRKRSKVEETFKNEMIEQEITEIIDCHIKLGTVVQFRGLLLSVVNDPGFWK